MRKQFSKLGSDLRYRRNTKRVRLFFAGISSIVLLIIVIIIAAVAGGKKKQPEVPGMNAEETQNVAADDNNAGQDSSADSSELDMQVNPSGEQTEPSTEAPVSDTGIYIAEGADAGEDYIKDTLFIGDSNTVRMMNYGITSVDNTIAVVGMGVQSIKTLQCVQFAGYSSPVTMVEAVRLMQPRRIIITFGTNNATGMPTDSFISQYDSALDAIHDAYPYADIIINSIPPMAQVNKYPRLSQKSIDDFNEALKQLAEKKGYKYLDTASVMKNPSTGFAKDGFTVGDGIHISDSGFAAMFTYIRTHARIVDDTRPKPLASIPKQQKATYVIDSSGKMNNDPNAYKEMSEVSKAEQEALRKAQEEALLKAAQEAKAKMEAEQKQTSCKHENYDTSIVKEPTESETGIRRYTCRNCGYVHEETIPRREHQHNFQDKGKKNSTHHILECSCGAEKQGEALSTQSVDPPSTPEPDPPADPTPSDPTPTDPTPTDPTPSDPTPEPDPTPSDPTPTPDPPADPPADSPVE